MSLSLNCLVLGDSPGRAFTVEIRKRENVSTLKDLIKEEKFPHLNRIAASDLDLWQVSFPADNLQAALEKLNLADYLKLSSPTKKITTFFKDVADDCLHVIVKAPSM
jgi:hypothetical protein